MIARVGGVAALLVAGLVLSILLLVDGTSPTVGWVGMSATVLLLAGDFGTTARPSPLLAVALAAGYAALVVWFACLATLLL